LKKFNSTDLISIFSKFCERNNKEKKLLIKGKKNLDDSILSPEWILKISNPNDAIKIDILY